MVASPSLGARFIEGDLRFPTLPELFEVNSWFYDESITAKKVYRRFSVLIDE